MKPARDHRFSPGPLEPVFFRYPVKIILKGNSRAEAKQTVTGVTRLKQFSLCRETAAWTWGFFLDTYFIVAFPYR